VTNKDALIVHGDCSCPIPGRDRLVIGLDEQTLTRLGESNPYDQKKSGASSFEPAPQLSICPKLDIFANYFSKCSSMNT
jgi:hypothetical protein